MAKNSSCKVVYRQTDAFIEIELDGELILTPNRDNAHGKRIDKGIVLSEVARDLWLSLKLPRTLSSLVENIVSKYDVTAEVVLVDVCEFVNALQEIGALAEELGNDCQ